MWEDVGECVTNSLSKHQFGAADVFLETSVDCSASRLLAVNSAADDSVHCTGTFLTNA